MSVALHKDLNSSAIMVGKALNNPAKGLTALTRVGVTFTEQQEKQIKALVESGKTMKAQKIILAELRSEFGGSAKAAGETLGGQINILRERFNNWAGDMVEKAIPMLKRLAAWFSKSILPALRDLGASIRKAWPDIQEFLQELFKGAQKLAPVWRLAIQIIVILIRVWAKFISVYAQGVGKIIEVTARFVGYLREKGGSALEFVRDKLALVRDTARFTFEFIRDKAQLVVDKVRLIIQKLKEFVGFVRGIPGKIGGVFSGVAGAIGGVFGGDGIVAAVGTGPSNISRTLYDDLALGNQAGLVLSSGYRPGAITSTGNPSLHGVFPAKAIDMAGSAAAMWRFFWAEVSRGASSGLREIIHSPYWWHPGVGVTRIPPSAGSVLADHYDHVHVGSYDRGGWLAPGWNLAFNGLGRRERVGGGDTIVNVHGAVIDGEKLYRLIREGEARWRRKNGG
jgi:hypothetical protein